MEVFQGTLINPVTISGIGLHSGRRVRLDILPAAPDTGISFLRTDRSESREVKACVENISATMLSTSLGFGPSTVATVEHLMAAFFFLQIDNARVLIDGGELPILDGSAAPFVAALEKAGIKRQQVAKKFLVIKEYLKVQDGDKYIEIEPGIGSVFSCEIKYPDRLIGNQLLSVNFSDNSMHSLLSSRTFCFHGDIPAMQQKGLALGGSLENAVVIKDEIVLNPEGLRFKDEFVRHKLLDCLGDFFLLGGALIGKIRMYKPGHDLNAKFMRELTKNYKSLIREVRLPDAGYAADSEKLQELRVASSL